MQRARARFPRPEIGRRSNAASSTAAMPRVRTPSCSTTWARHGGGQSSARRQRSSGVCGSISTRAPVRGDGRGPDLGRPLRTRPQKWTSPEVETRWFLIPKRRVRRRQRGSPRQQLDATDASSWPQISVPATRTRDSSAFARARASRTRFPSRRSSSAAALHVETGASGHRKRVLIPDQQRVAPCAVDPPRQLREEGRASRRVVAGREPRPRSGRDGYAARREP